MIIERLNMVKRHMKARGVQQPGGIVEKEAPIHVSNVHDRCATRATSRRASDERRSSDGTRVRVCRRCDDTAGRLADHGRPTARTLSRTRSRPR